jgi:ornithine carbamoyltransferase
VNALTDEHHPCQALADLLTLRERFGQLEGLRVAFVGAGNNVATSLVEAGALARMEVVVASPPGYEPDVPGAYVVADPLEAVAGADAVYTDVWVSMGEDAERGSGLPRPSPTGSTRGSWPPPDPTRSSCTASPPTGARR